MSISNMRKDLEAIKSSAEAGNIQQVVERVNRTLKTLEESRLLTTTEAASLLGIRSVNTLKLLIRQLGISYERHGNRMMIALDDVERLKASRVLKGIHASDQAHDVVDNLGASGPLTQEQMETLEAERPGVAPWQRSTATTTYE
jgi:excisionase family DNA binding protein